MLSHYTCIIIISQDGSVSVRVFRFVFHDLVGGHRKRVLSVAWMIKWSIHLNIGPLLVLENVSLPLKDDYISFKTN